MYFRPGLHKEAGLAFSPIKAIVSPRPIGWISSCGKDGSINLAPYSYFNAISELPPMVMFSSAPSGNAQHKDSLRNVIETEEFVVNIVSAALGDAMNVTSADLAYGQNEFAAAGLEMADCNTVKVPRVAAAPAALECKLWKVIELPKPETAGAGTGDGVDGYNDVVFIIPPTVVKCIVAAIINWSTIIPVLFVGGIGAFGVQTPGVVTLFEFTNIF